jgi:hypothetical protein
LIPLLASLPLDALERRQNAAALLSRQIVTFFSHRNY